jgi:hypothetical protein
MERKIEQLKQIFDDLVNIAARRMFRDVEIYLVINGVPVDIDHTEIGDDIRLEISGDLYSPGFKPVPVKWEVER